MFFPMVLCIGHTVEFGSYPFQYSLRRFRSLCTILSVSDLKKWIENDMSWSYGKSFDELYKSDAYFIDSVGERYHFSEVYRCLFQSSNVHLKQRNYLFRNGPVPDIRKSRKRKFYRNYYRTPKRMGWIAGDNNLSDMEYEEGVSIKGRKCPITEDFVFDDYPRSCIENRNWKRFRKTQWK